VVLQVLAHRGAIGLDLDPVVFQMRRRADAGQHQDLRAAESTRAQHHAAACAQHFAPVAKAHRHSGRAAILDHDAFDQCAGLYGQVRLGRQVGAGSGPAFAALLRDLVQPEPVLRRTVEVRVGPQLQGFRTGDEGSAARIGPVLIDHGQRSVRAMETIFAAFVALGPFEIGQDIVIGPARATEAGPLVIVKPVAAHVKHGIDRRRAAQPASTRLVSDPSVQAFLRDGFKGPVGVLGQEGQHSRGLDPEVVVGPARFHHADGPARIFGQASGNRTAGAAPANDDDVKLVHASSSFYVLR